MRLTVAFPILLCVLFAFSSCRSKSSISAPSNLKLAEANDAESPDSNEVDGSELEDQTVDDGTLATVGSTQEAAKIGSDNSQINTMYDGYGNKTELRNFSSHPLIKHVILRTAPNGQQMAYAYGHNGEVKLLPEGVYKNAMSSSADDIARVAGITEGRKETFAPSPEQTEYTMLPPVARPSVVAETESPTEEITTSQKESLQVADNSVKTPSETKSERLQKELQTFDPRKPRSQ